MTRYVRTAARIGNIPPGRARPVFVDGEMCVKTYPARIVDGAVEIGIEFAPPMTDSGTDNESPAGRRSPCPGD